MFDANKTVVFLIGFGPQDTDDEDVGVDDGVDIERLDILWQFSSAGDNASEVGGVIPVLLSVVSSIALLSDGCCNSDSDDVVSVQTNMFLIDVNTSDE